MDVETIRCYCLSFPHAKETLQWGETLCFKVRGKIFAMLSLDAVPATLCFKCAPETFAELVERAGVMPAPYVGRYKWALMERLDALSLREAEGLIRQSYEMVATKAGPSKRTKKKRAKPGAKLKVKQKPKQRSKR